MKVRDLMTRQVQCINPDNTLQEAAALMRTLDVGPLPVCNDGKLVGMLTDRDITLRSTAAGQDPTIELVRDVMTPVVFFCYEDQDVADAAGAMKTKQVRRLIVLDRDQRLVGILALGDVAVDAGDEELTGEILERISEPAGPQH